MQNSKFDIGNSKTSKTEQEATEQTEKRGGNKGPLRSLFSLLPPVGLFCSNCSEKVFKVLGITCRESSGHRKELGFMAEEQTPARLVEEIRGEQRRCWQAGERISAETYLQRYPALQSDPDCALEVVYGEVMLREEHGEE